MKRIVLPALALVLLGAGCAPWNWGIESQPIMRPSVAPAPVPKHELSAFSSADLGLAFAYPAAWGAVRIQEEAGSNAGVLDGCIYMRTVQFSQLESGTLLAAVATEGCDPPARDGWWADQASGYVSDLAYLTDCETGSASTCKTFTNDNGERVWHWHFVSFERPYGEDPLTNVNEYGMFHEGHALAGIAISDQPLIENLEAGWKNELADLVRSISFVD